MDETKKKRTMTPEMLEKLALAREKAMVVRRQIKAEKDAKDLEELPAKLEQKAKIKAELNLPKEPRPEFRTKKKEVPIPEDNPVMDSPDDSEASEVDEPPPPPVKTKKKKKIVVVEESSSDEETYVYVPKRPPRLRPPPKQRVEYQEPVEWKQPPIPLTPIPLTPPPPQAPTYNELARASLHTFGSFPRRF